MAWRSAPDVVDLISDDDSAEGVLTHTSSQARQNGTRKPNTSDFAKRNLLSANNKKTSHAQDGFVGRQHASATSSSKHPTTTRRSADSTPRSSRDRDPSPVSIMSNGRNRETKHMSTSNGSANGLTRRKPEVIDLLDDDEPPKKSKSLKPPRGLSPPKVHTNGPLEARNFQRLSSPNKRSRDDDSPSASSNSSKKLKTNHDTPAEKIPVKHGSASWNGEKPFSTSRTPLPVKFSPAISRASGQDALAKSASSSPRRRRNATAGLSEDEQNTSSASETMKSGARIKKNGMTYRVSSPLGQRRKDKKTIDEKATSTPRKQHNASNGNSVSTSGSLEELKHSTPRTKLAKARNGRQEKGDDGAASPLRADVEAEIPNKAKLFFSRAKSPPTAFSLRHDVNVRRKQKQTSSRSTPVEDPSFTANHLLPRLLSGSRSSSPGKERTASQKSKQKTAVGTGTRLEGSPETNDVLDRPDVEPVAADKISSEVQELLQLPDIVLTFPSSRASAESQRSLQTSNPKPTEAAKISDSPSTREKYIVSNRVTESDEADLQLRSEALQGSIAEDVATADSESAFARPVVAASKLKASALYSGQSLANHVERVLGGYMEELRGDSEYWTSVALRRARLSQENDSGTSFKPPQTDTTEEPTSFANLKPLRFSPHKKGSSTAKSEEVWSIQRMTYDGRPQGQMELSAPYTTFATDEQDVPDFAHYVSIQNNLLAPNVIHLHCWPYFGDDFDMNEAQNLSSQYNIDISARERKLLLLLQAQMHESYVESALKDLDCSFADVLRFLLEASPDVGVDPEAIKARQNRGLYCQEDFSRTSDRWVAVLSRLPPSTPSQLGRIALLCENFQKMAKFSLWHIARKSKFAELLEEDNEGTSTRPSNDELTCRICLRFNCPYHGQFKHRPDDDGDESDTGSISSVDTAVATDIVHPLKANYRSRVTFMPDENATAKAETIVDPLLRKKKRDQNYWNGYKHKADERGPFYPCHHPGLSCSTAKCSCFTKMIPCEKTCSCAPDCARKFKGCACGTRKGNQMVCAENPECVCWQNGRECDPDLCGSCGVCDVVDPVNKHDDGIVVGRCRNASIQRGVPKHTLLGDSGVHGLGLYACEDIKHHHFVGEYKGEIITKKEADRRGAVYEHQKLSYLFSLNKSQEIDSTYFGNKVRFINHAHGEKANLYPRIIMVNTVHRIALYASKDIQAGKELLFDYGPLFPDEQLQGKKSKKSAPESKKSAPHVRNANLVKEFYDVEESEDEDGFLRAKAVSRGRGRPSHKKSRPRTVAGKKGLASKPNQPEAGMSAKVEAESQHQQHERERGQDAGERLAAFNISDDTPSEVVDADAGADVEEDEEEDAAFEPEDSESVDSEGNTSESRSDEEEDEEDEDRHPVRRGRGRPRGSGMSTRKRGRR